jgi:rhamnosyltransferase
MQSASFLIVIVLYKVKLLESDSFRTLTDSLRSRHQKADLFIYDNSPASDVPSDSLYQEWTFHYYHNPSNPGVSTAYNEGAKLARQLSKDWIILVDQDTIFPENTFSRYQQALVDHPTIPLFAPILTSNQGMIYSPCPYLFKRGFPAKELSTGIQNFRKKTVLNSGMLISLNAFESVGGYNTDLPLDFSDFNFIDKLREIYSHFVVIDLYCVHELSPNIGDYSSSLSRFERYCNGIKFHVTQPYDRIILYLLTFLRAIKLSVKFSNLVFIKSFIKTI